jgi:uncharacterized membrane-anchored protein
MGVVKRSGFLLAMTDDVCKSGLQGVSAMFRHVVLFSLAACLCAGDPEGSEPAGANQLHKLAFTTGTVTVGQQLATIALPADCRYLAGADAQFWVEKVWHNPHDADIVGMVVPVELATWYEALAESKPSDPEPDAPARSWGMVVSWGGETGHVEDSDARSTDFDALLKDMQEGTQESNSERIRAGYGKIDLLGWAEPPHYDSGSKKLYWAKSLRFNQDPQPTLNYCVRVLGARGVLELNAVDDQSALKEVAASAKLILNATNFTAGNRYADYKSGVDPLAAGGIAALVGGGLVAKKLGLLAVFGVFILKFAKILILPAIILGGWIMKKVRA